MHHASSSRHSSAGVGPAVALSLLLLACSGPGGDGADGSVSGDAVTPAGDAAPDGGGCASPCAPGGSLRCQDEAVERCTDDGTGCLAWTVETDCADQGLTCVDTGPEPVCQPAGTLLGSKGMWVWGATIRGAEAAFLDVLAAHGFSDVFVLIKGVSGTVAHDVLDALVTARDAAGHEIRIWAWVIAFNDESYTDDFDGTWVDPGDATYRAGLLGVVEETLGSHRPDGIMLDCLRYPGNAAGDTASITSFGEEVRARVDAANAAQGSQILVGAAIMPELGGGNEEAYGQDAAQLAVALDVVAPMVYRYNYAETASWIADMIAATIAEVGAAAEVWPIVQNYAGDETPDPLSAAALRPDLAAALQPCPTGFSVFQYGQLIEDQWSALDERAVGTVVCGGEEPPPATNLDRATYHQQPLSSNDDGPFYGTDTYEGWCNTASVYMVLHSLVPDLPARLQALDPGWESWRGGSVPAEDPYLYEATTTYPVEEFLQDRYLGYLIGSSGIGYDGIETMVLGVATELGLALTLEYVPLAELRDRLLAGWFGIMNNWEWGGHYFVVAWYEAGADPEDPAQRYYYILDPTSIESTNTDILDHLEPTRTASFRALIQSRQLCGAVSCESERLGVYVLTATGVNAVYKGNQAPEGTLPMIRLD